MFNRHEAALICLVAFSSREPVSASPPNPKILSIFGACTYSIGGPMSSSAAFFFFLSTFC
jgi:hypothetical protein